MKTIGAIESRKIEINSQRKERIKASKISLWTRWPTWSRQERSTGTKSLSITKRQGKTPMNIWVRPGRRRKLNAQWLRELCSPIKCRRAVRWIKQEIWSTWAGNRVCKMQMIRSNRQPFLISLNSRTTSRSVLTIEKTLKSWSRWEPSKVSLLSSQWLIRPSAI